jgi:hypothetical protein
MHRVAQGNAGIAVHILGCKLVLGRLRIKPSDKRCQARFRVRTDQPARAAKDQAPSVAVDFLLLIYSPVPRRATDWERPTSRSLFLQNSVHVLDLSEEVVLFLTNSEKLQCQWIF